MRKSAPIRGLFQNQHAVRTHAAMAIADVRNCVAAKLQFPARLSSMTKSLPAPFILVKRSIISPARAGRETVAGCSLRSLLSIVCACSFASDRTGTRLPCRASRVAPPRRLPLNDAILEQIERMPVGGDIRPRAWLRFVCNRQLILSRQVFHSAFGCISELLLRRDLFVFMKTIEAARAGAHSSRPSTLEQLIIRGQRDGAGHLGPLERQRSGNSAVVP